MSVLINMKSFNRRRRRRRKGEARKSHSFFIEFTTSCVNLAGSTCHAPQGPTSVMLCDGILVSESVEEGARQDEQALKKAAAESFP
jgi:hypothetical protein